MIDNGRLYPDRQSYYIERANIKRTPGNGIRVYEGFFDGIIGKILKLFDKAIYVKHGERTYLVNSNSLSEYILRKFDINQKQFQFTRRPISIPNVPKEMQNEYEQIKKDMPKNHAQTIVKIKATFQDKINPELNQIITDGITWIPEHS